MNSSMRLPMLRRSGLSRVANQGHKRLPPTPDYFDALQDCNMNLTSRHRAARCVCWYPALRREAVPEAGRAFLELARRVGVFEDGQEARVVRLLTENDREALVFFRANYPVEVDQWLRGDEAMATPPSVEYRAFSCLYFAAEYLCGASALDTKHTHRPDAKALEWH